MRARGTHGNIAHRFQPDSVDPVDDGWHREAEPDSIATEVREVRADRIISTNQSPDVPFSQSINPYQGCEHGCIYCFARPTHSYQELSPGLDFETRIIAKPNAAKQLRATLDKPGYRPSPIALGVNTDAYQPLEKRYRLTREILEVLLEYRHPVSIITKSGLILRDLDLLEALAARGLCSVSVSLTTLDNRLKGQLEPRATAAATRLKVVREMAGHGVPVGVLTAPIIPFINDHEMESMLEAAADSGAERADWVLLRLPHEVAPLFETWLETHYPDRAGHVMNRICDLRGGRTNNSSFGERMRGTGPLADLYRQRFHRKCRALGLNKAGEEPLDTGQFRRPAGEQMGLF
ncbi:DNA repair photolyase [Halospina denitrificans]|uniref:DNA repair photolyase n=1 Tax=Halospina denitrificans TaxID=332522 RepID=A0A4R7JXZ9_9GAMM|nr:PA0069 family radical SAM protein [Halospina denitrificans]TDT43370.1 DNA repair photolyase [Halospina denitrificans]